MHGRRGYCILLILLDGEVFFGLGGSEVPFALKQSMQRVMLVTSTHSSSGRLTSVAYETMVNPTGMTMPQKRVRRVVR